MSRVALPFLVLSVSAVKCDGWLVGLPGEPLSRASDILDGWDYDQDIHVSTTVEIDFEQAALDLGLQPSDLRLAAVLMVGTGAGNLPRRLDRLATEILSADRATCELRAVIPGSSLSGRVRLGLHLLLEAPLYGGSALSPRHRGSRLWCLDKDILIEDGGDARFPVELVSFSRETVRNAPWELARNAPWMIDWNPSQLEADFSGNVRLYVNSDNKAIAERFVEGDPATLQVMVADVMTQLIQAVLIVEDEEGLSQYDEGSIGHQAAVWLEMAFPGQRLTHIRDEIGRFPGRFRAAILAAAEMGGDE